MNAHPNDKSARMREKDVRNGEPVLNPSSFLAAYLRFVVKEKKRILIRV